MVNENNSMLCKRLTHLDYSTIDYKNTANANLSIDMSRKSEDFITNY
jgi:hypothetical protein